MHDMSLAYIFFRLLNFGIFCTISVIVYKRYLRPALAEQIHERDHYEHDLSQQLQQTAALVKQKKEEFAHAQLEGKQLVERMAQWHNFRLGQHAATIALNKQREQKAQERLRHMNEHYFHEQLHEAIREPALKQAEQELIVRFESKDARERYIEKALKALAHQESK